MRSGSPEARSTALAMSNVAGRFQRAAQQGNVDVLRRLIDEGVEPDTVDEDGNTALMVLAREGRADGVGLLLSAGAEVEMMNVSGASALMLAAANGHLEVVKLLAAGPPTHYRPLLPPSPATPAQGALGAFHPEEGQPSGGNGTRIPDAHVAAARVAECVQKLVGPKAPITRVMTTFHQLDRDKTGTITLETFVAAAGRLGLQEIRHEPWLAVDVFSALTGGRSALSIASCERKHRENKLRSTASHLQPWQPHLPPLFAKYAGGANAQAAASGGRGGRGQGALGKLDLSGLRRLIRRGCSIGAEHVSDGDISDLINYIGNGDPNVRLSAHDIDAFIVQMTTGGSLTVSDTTAAAARRRRQGAPAPRPSPHFRRPTHASSGTPQTTPGRSKLPVRGPRSGHRAMGVDAPGNLATPAPLSTSRRDGAIYNGNLGALQGDIPAALAGMSSLQETLELGRSLGLVAQSTTSENLAVNLKVRVLGSHTTPDSRACRYCIDRSQARFVCLFRA